MNSPWYTNEIDKAISNKDTERASYLAFKSFTDPAKNEFARKTFDNDFAGTYNWSENNPDGLSVMSNSGKELFKIVQQKPEEPSWLESVLRALDFIGEDGGGYQFVTSGDLTGSPIGQVREGKSSRIIDIGPLMMTIGAAGSAAATSYISGSKNPDEVIQGIKQIIDAGQIGGDTGGTLDIEGRREDNYTIFKCNECKQTFKDSLGVSVPSDKTPLEKRSTHLPDNL